MWGTLPADTQVPWHSCTDSAIYRDILFDVPTNILISLKLLKLL